MAPLLRSLGRLGIRVFPYLDVVKCLLGDHLDGRQHVGVAKGDPAIGVGVDSLGVDAGGGGKPTMLSAEYRFLTVLLSTPGNPCSGTSVSSTATVEARLADDHQIRSHCPGNAHTPSLSGVQVPDSDQLRLWAISAARFRHSEPERRASPARGWCVRSARERTFRRLGPAVDVRRA